MVKYPMPGWRGARVKAILFVSQQSSRGARGSQSNMSVPAQKGNGNMVRINGGETDKKAHNETN